MAKKKKKATVVAAHRLTPEQYIKQKARTLPIAECRITEQWEKTGSANIIVTRRHTNGHYTCGIYWVDMHCLGIVDSFYRFSIDEEDYQELLRRSNHPAEISYELAHNLIYGSIAFAEEAGLEPHSSFNLTQYLLEEDTEDIPLIEYAFGHEGKHLLIVKDELTASRYIPTIEKHLGKNYDYIIGKYVPGDDEDGDDELYPIDPDFDDDGEYFREQLEKRKKEKATNLYDELLQQVKDEIRNMPETVYCYADRPPYPVVLEMKHSELAKLFDNKQFVSSREEIAHILSLPRQSLLRDLEQMTLFEIGCTYEVTEEMCAEPAPYLFVHALLLFGELREERTLKIVLELLRQDEKFMEYHLGDSRYELFVPTLYLLGQHRLMELMAYLHEPNRNTYSRYYVSAAVAKIALLHPERREEVIEWFRRLLLFYRETIAETVYCDGSTVGLMMINLCEIQPKELLPEIKALYDTGLVGRFVCGDYIGVERKICFASAFCLPTPFLTNVHERYESFKNNYKL